MFGQPNTRVSIVNFGGVRIKDAREQDPTHLIDISMETPFTPTLAEDISPKIMRDVFDEVHDSDDGWSPKPEMTQVNLNLSPGAQILTIRAHPELEPVARVEGVLLRHVKIRKQAKADVWMLSWVNTFNLDPEVVAGLMRYIKVGVFVTYEKQQGDLAFEGGDEKADDSGAGRVTTGRKRGRPRKVKSTEVQPSLGSVDTKTASFEDVPPSNAGDVAPDAASE
jgi:hypothetical protein